MNLMDVHVVGSWKNQEQQFTSIVVTAKKEEERDTRIPVFYNAFVASPQQIPDVEELVNEQLSFLVPHLHGPVYLTTIGQNITTDAPSVLRQHLPTGDEAKTLQALWEYCTEHPTSKVIYLHSKGSFHPSPANTQLRLFLTRGALSAECASTDSQTCNVCSSRFSPLPHPHTPGNMWLAHCDYVNELIEPRLFTVLMDALQANIKRSWLDIQQTQKLWIKWYTTGTKRFAQEHWIHSHPTVKPCDLYPSDDFVWGYDNIPDYNFTAQFATAVRFADIDAYRRGDFGKLFPGLFLQERLYEYEFLYDQKPPDSWWGWDLFWNTSETDHGD